MVPIASPPFAVEEQGAGGRRNGIDGLGGKMSAILALALLLPGHPAGNRQDAEGSALRFLVPLEVRSVVSGGYWETPEEHGIYRVIIVESGWERVTCTASLEWIAERDETESRQVVASREITEISEGTLSLGLPTFTLAQEGSGTILSIEATGSHPGGDSTFVFRLGTPGSVLELP
jgi:hypothetical protein